MTLWAYAFETLAGVKTNLGITGVNVDPIIETCINEASQMVEDAWGRHVVSRGSLTEYHPRETSMSEISGSAATYALAPGYARYDPYAPAFPTRPAIYLNEWPVVSVTSINEDPARVYAAASLLVADTDYILTKPSGKLTRVSGSLPKSWIWSYRSVKVVYIGGYQNTNGSITGADAIPFALMRVFHELVRWMIDQRKPGGAVGVNSISDATGNRSFSGPAYITPAQMAALDSAGAMRGMLRNVTGDRDS